MSASHNVFEKRLWDAADELRANSKLKSSEYSVPVLGLIFLRYGDQKFADAEKTLSKQASGRRKIGKTDYHQQGILLDPVLCLGLPGIVCSQKIGRQSTQHCRP